MGKHIGIYGGGQLGLYLCRAARKLGLETTVVTPDRTSPACAAADHVLEGSLGDLDLAARLVGSVDVITFEIEAVPAPVLEYLAAAEARGEIEVAPGARVLLRLQNKAGQKAWMRDHDLPTADFEVLDGGRPDGARLAARFGLPFVQKLQQGGYDGRGVQIIRDEADLAQLWTEPSLVEAFVPDVQEIAVLVARGRDGTVRTYAPVSLAFNAELNVLETVIAPARIRASTAGRARRIARRAIETLDGVGLFAVEMFLCEDGRLLINEISPRVHNAGHHTLEACTTSQFEQHLRAVAGLPLGKVTQRGVAVMRNLLWSPELERLRSMHGFVETGGGNEFALHWYGKRVPKPWRKMGHITCLGREENTALLRSELFYRVVATPVRMEAA
jgi:5-(carboxyamino)imidazole ribonucleotide synthase